MGGSGEPKPVEAAWALIEERRASGRRAPAATEPAAAAVDGPSESPSAADAAGMAVQEVLVDIIPRGSAAAAAAKEGLELPQAVVALA
jgi:hypothetical protein